MNWETIYATEAPKLLAVCRRYINDCRKAEDLMHDSFLTAIKKQDQYSEKGAIGAWLRRITVNTVLQYLRKEKGFLELTSRDEDCSVSFFEKEEPQGVKGKILAADFDKSELLAVIDTLPEHHKVVFNLYVFEGFTHKEIGKKLNISAGTSKSHLARARKKIQKILAAKAEEMKKKKNKRAATFPFFFGKGKDSHYLDELFREKIADSDLSPQGAIPKSLQSALKNAAPLNTAKATMQSLKSVLFTSLSVVVIAGAVLFLASEKSPPENSSEDLTSVSTKIISAPASEIVTENIDTFLNNSITEISPQENKIEKNTAIPIPPQGRKILPPKQEKTEKLPPVVVKKNVTVRDTVFEIIEEQK